MQSIVKTFAKLFTLGVKKTLNVKIVAHDNHCCHAVFIGYKRHKIKMRMKCFILYNRRWDRGVGEATISQFAPTNKDETRIKTVWLFIILCLSFCSISVGGYDLNMKRLSPRSQQAIETSRVLSYSPQQKLHPTCCMQYLPACLKGTERGSGKVS